MRLFYIKFDGVLLRQLRSYKKRGKLKVRSSITDEMNLPKQSGRAIQADVKKRHQKQIDFGRNG